jgi:hypothetical protein
MIRKAFDVLKDQSADGKTRELAERREKTLKDEAMYLEEVRRKGEKRGEILGEIQIYQELMKSSLIPKDMAEQKIAQLNLELKKFTKKSVMYPEQ